ncbi:hypothetical protein ABT023_00260 [Micromonospora sp. NPDC002296]|uniref:hypothetical protein n=1 Tax=Micromonospora sp. NPDC002296 TaxID=3154271 RepID=UPI003317DC1B
MARHAKNPTHPGLLRWIWPFKRRRTKPLDHLGPATIHPTRPAAYRAIGVARVTYLPERPLPVLAGKHQAGCWS